MIKSWRMIWTGHVARLGEKWNAYGLSVGKQQGKRPLQRPRRMWVDKIEIDLGEIGWDVELICLAQHAGKWRALLNAIMNHQVA
jgi:hypothetical protein